MSRFYDYDYNSEDFKTTEEKTEEFLFEEALKKSLEDVKISDDDDDIIFKELKDFDPFKEHEKLIGDQELGDSEADFLKTLELSRKMDIESSKKEFSDKITKLIEENNEYKEKCFNLEKENRYLKEKLKKLTDLEK